MKAWAFLEAQVFLFSQPAPIKEATDEETVSHINIVSAKIASLPTES